MLSTTINEVSLTGGPEPKFKDRAAQWQEAQRVEHLYKHAITSALAGSLGLIIIGVILYASMRLDRIFWWLVIAVPIQMLWIPLHWQFANNKRKASVTRWKHAHGAMSLLTGLCLAAAPLMIFPLSGIEDRMILIVMFAGFIAVSANTNAPCPPSFLLYSYPTGITMMIMLCAQMTPESLGKAAMVGVFLITMHRTNLQTNAMINENLELAQALRYAASHDPLVGLANRTEFSERLDQIAAQSQRFGQLAAIISIDLDHFKSLNDHFGHAQGDRALIAVGAAMRNATRADDIVARLGGDEFVIVIFPASADQADRVAEKLLTEISGLAIATDNAGQTLSASIGVAISAPSGFDPDTLLAQSDQACYRAKRGGRNRCETTSA